MSYHRWALQISRRVVVAAAAASSVLALGMAPQALAGNPTGGYAVFTQCPVNNKSVELCVYANTTSGEFTIGKITVPIKNAITLQGGLTETEAFVGAANGETLSKTPQKVPGGLAGLIKCNEIGNTLERIVCEIIFENKVTGVNETTELAGTPVLNKGNLIGEEGTALALPVRVHLENPLLGNDCYIGSTSNPVTINFTTGTTKPPSPNKPIKGFKGEPEFKEGVAALFLNNGTLVENAFAAPTVEGCGGLLSFLLDPIIDGKLGLPSTAGHNTAILKGDLAVANAEAVKASE